MQTLTTIEMDLPEPASDDNAERARHWHSLVQKHGRLTLEAAAHLGEVLIEQRDLCKLESKRGGSGWSQWCDDNLSFSRASAIQYIKLAENWELVSALTSTEKPTSLREALKLVDESEQEKPSSRPAEPRHVNTSSSAVDWYPSNFGECPAVGDDLGQEQSANLWLDAVTEKLESTGAASGHDISALRYFAACDVLRTAANSPSADASKNVIDGFRDHVSGTLAAAMTFYVSETGRIHTTVGDISSESKSISAILRYIRSNYPQEWAIGMNS